MPNFSDSIAGVDDSPIGIGRQWPKSRNPIEVGSNDSICFIINNATFNDKSISNRLEISITIENRVFWNRQVVSRDEFLMGLARHWNEITDPFARTKLFNELHHYTSPPILYVQRQGNVFALLWHENGEQIWAFISALDFLRTLTFFGGAIAQRLLDIDGPRLHWIKRQPTKADDLHELDVTLLGYPEAEIASLELHPITNNSDLWFPDDARLVARMGSGHLSIKTLRLLLRTMRQMEPRDSIPLDDIASSLPIPSPNEAPWKQGQIFGRSLRSFLNREEGGINVEEFLLEQGVQIKNVRSINSALDAVAVWGEYGPGVIVNINGVRAHHENGRRFTLAHELCHLLFDRFSGEKFSVDFIGSFQKNDRYEKRANAFAAEFLVPSLAAVLCLGRTGSVDDTVSLLTQQYHVGPMPVLQHLRNAAGSAGGPTQGQLADIEAWLHQIKLEYKNQVTKIWCVDTEDA